MESFAKLKQRGADLIQSLPHSMPAMPAMPALPHVHLPSMRSGGHGMKGTWQRIPLPPLPRSSHSLDIVAGNAYIFGGEGAARDKSTDNDMHIVTLPCSGAPADYYSVKAKPSPKTEPVGDGSTTTASTTITEEDESESELRDPLDEVPLSSPPPLGSTRATEAAHLSRGKGKGRAATTAEVPPPRVGHVTAVIGTRIFLFGGRSAGDETSTALDEGGRVWVFETKTHTWTYLDPHHSSPVPTPRSDHRAAATDKPREFAPIGRLRRSSTWKEWAEGDSAEKGIPQRPIAGSIAERATDEEADDTGFGTFIIHGGRSVDSDGDGDGMTADVWAFDVRARSWKQLPDAPGPARANASFVLAKGQLYRFGGVEASGRVLGGRLDVLRLALDKFDDQNAQGEIGVFARGGWETIVAPSAAPSPETAALTTAAPKHVGTATDPWPSPRSGSGLSLIQAGGGREYLVLTLGQGQSTTTTTEGDAEEKETEGTFHSDVWAFQVPPLGGTAASVTDAFLYTVGRSTGESRWFPISVGAYDPDDGHDVRGPGPRGHFAAAPLGDLEENAIFLFGGRGPGGSRLADGWIFRLD